MVDEDLGGGRITKIIIVGDYSYKSLRIHRVLNNLKYYNAFIEGDLARAIKDSYGVMPHTKLLISLDHFDGKIIQEDSELYSVFFKACRAFSVFFTGSLDDAAHRIKLDELRAFYYPYYYFIQTSTSDGELQKTLSRFLMPIDLYSAQ